jgi:lipoate-protein ligase A
MTVWRLLIDGPGRGAWNMAVDRAMQEAHAAGKAPPTLRLYEWSAPTVSLGRFQRLDGLDLDVCAAEGIDIVRRHTGGRGVLHDHEVTYSVVAGVRDGVPRGVVASYAYLSEALAAVYRNLGVDARITSRPRGDADSAACYLHATKADLSTGGAKLSGSAQVWLESTCLQHGSFTLRRDLAREVRVFRLDEKSAETLASTTAALDGLLERSVSREELAGIVVSTFSEVLRIDLIPGELSDREHSRVIELMAVSIRDDPLNPDVSG